MKLFIKFKESPQIFFVVTATLFGVIFLFLIPPFQTPDEYIHFYRAYETSEFKMPEYNKDKKGSGSYLPRSINETEEALRGGPNKIRFNPREKYDHRLTKSALSNVPLDKNDRIFYDTVTSAPQYLPASYGLQAFIISIAKLFDSPVVLMIYLVRLSNLMLWVTIGYFAIKIFPVKKWALVTVMLIPIMVAQSISIGLDAPIYGSAILFMAIIYSALYDKRIKLSWLKILLLLVASVVMVFGKMYLLLLLPLVFYIRRKQLPNQSVLLRPVLTIIPIVLYIAWSIFTQNVNPSADHTASAGQISSILDNIFVFPAELMSTFFFVWGDSIMQSLIGNFGWLDTPLSAPFVCLGFTILIFALLVNYEIKPKIADKQHKIILALISLGYFTAVSLAMYIYSSEKSLKYITGIQGRYFVPLLVLFIPLMHNNRLNISRSDFKKVVQISTFALLVISVITILFRYYIVYYPQV